MTRVLLISLAILLVAGASYAGETWNATGRPSVCDTPTGPRLERCQEWVRTVQRPDYRGASCCGEGDSFIADNFEQGPNGELYAIISADYPSAPNATFENDGVTPVAPAFSVHKGDKILIPPEKMNVLPEDANRSGHGVVFLMPSNGQVLCFFFPPLI